VTRARLCVVGVAVLWVGALLLPWFGETRRDKTTSTYNAWQSGWPWALLLVVLVCVHVVLALYGSSRDVRALPYAGLCVLAITVVTLARCWMHLDASVDGAEVDRRWGLFITLNLIPLFGLAMRAIAKALTSQMMPPATERDYGFGIA
jgi:hypothetical protein